MNTLRTAFIVFIPFCTGCLKEPITWNLPRNNAGDTAQNVNPNHPNAPIARFNASTTRVPLGGKVKFISTSTQNPTVFSWYFPEASPARAAGSSAEATFNRLGYYDVQLSVRNSFGSDSTLRKAYIEAFYFKSFADKDWEDWFSDGWMFTSGQVCNGCVLAWQNSSSAPQLFTLSRDFSNMPSGATLSFYYQIYSPGGYLRVRLNGVEIWNASGYGKANPKISIPLSGSYEVSIEALVAYTQSIYVNDIEIRP
ncbi:MAG: hypothetical protein RL160_1551 [Bacteroidota bacterium]|jgi:PKD repeat protein